MDHDLQQTIALLTRTPAALDALLHGLPDEWTRQNEGPDTWSAFDVLVHLINCERTDWMPRVRVLLEFGESQPFPPFDRWGEIRESQGKPLSELLDVFAQLRTQNIAALQALELQSEDFARRGLHPSFGSVALSELLATWAAHDLNHLHQIARVMAHQYRQAVGPWSRYMGVMQCGGHSSS
jgi:DinB superfamily